MKHKKFLSLIMALAMVFSLSVSVFAEGEGTTEEPAAGEEVDLNSFTAEAEVKVPTIDVSLSSNDGAIFINPMGFTIDLEGDHAGEATAAVAESDDDDDEDTEAPALSGDAKVASPMYTIENNSPMKLAVYAQPLATPSTENTVISVTNGVQIADTSTKNDVFIYAEFQNITAEADTDADEPTLLPYEPFAQTAYTAPAEDATVFPLLGIPTKALKSPVQVGTIEKVTKAAADDDETPDLPGVMGFRFWGNTNDKAKADWTTASGETVTVTIAFTFKPDLTSDTPAVTPAEGEGD